jgi:hypothetical protein
LSAAVDLDFDFDFYVLKTHPVSTEKLKTPKSKAADKSVSAPHRSRNQAVLPLSIDQDPVTILCST